MPLPPLTMPNALPAFLIEGHAATWGAVFGNVAMRTGHSRKRRLWTTMPHRVAAQLFLERDEMIAFHAWFLESLRSGERRFAARVKNQGEGLLWYTAFFLQPYTAEALHFGRWKVAADLLLEGEGEVDGPTAGLFSAEVLIPFTGSGTITVEKIFAAEISIDFLVSEDS
jgi:hypothetical protein